METTGFAHILDSTEEVKIVLFPRLYVTFVVNRLSQLMHPPTEDHWQVAKRILRYFAGTTTHGIFYAAKNDITFHAFSDADWAGNSDDSSQQMLIYYTWVGIRYLGHQRKKNSVVRSSTQAEYRPVANTAFEFRWVCSHLIELGIILKMQHVVY